MRALNEGLNNHFTYEEEVLPPLLGELFIRTLILEHQNIKKDSNDTQQIVDNIKLEGLGREESGAGSGVALSGEPTIRWARPPPQTNRQKMRAFFDGWSGRGIF